MTTVPAAATPLYALPPSQFVAARNALAKELAERGDRSAAAVRKLARPTGLAWVMNRLSRERPSEVAALLEAGDRLMRGQRRALAGKGADELRAGEAELRRGARALRDAAAPILGEKGRAGALSRLELLLRIAASSPVAREALRAGLLEREPEAEPVDLSGLALVEGGAPPRRADGAGGRARSAGPTQARERASLRAREAARRAARAALARAEAAARRAEADAQRADAAARRAAERAQALRRRADAARDEARSRAQAVETLGEAGPAATPSPEPR